MRKRLTEQDHMKLAQLLYQGRTYREIAKVLFLSPYTVRNRVDNLCKELSVKDRHEALQVAKKLGWLNELLNKGRVSDLPTENAVLSDPDCRY